MLQYSIRTSAIFDEVNCAGIFSETNVTAYSMRVIVLGLREGYEIKIEATLRNFIKYCSKTWSML